MRQSRARLVLKSLLCCAVLFLGMGPQVSGPSSVIAAGGGKSGTASGERAPGAAKLVLLWVAH